MHFLQSTQRGQLNSPGVRLKVAMSLELFQRILGRFIFEKQTHTLPYNLLPAKAETAIMSRILRI